MPEQNKAECFSEYDKLEQVILCEPKYMTIQDTINETQKHYKKEGINVDRAMKQHRHFVGALKDQGIDVVLLSPLEKYPEQVFTRDIGFTLGKKVYVAEMAADIRQGEENLLKHWLEEQQIPFSNLTGDRIEGGDVLIDGKTIYIGVSNRTFEEAIDHLRSLIHEFEIISVPFTDTYLHLDCVFNIISPEEALIFPGEIHGEKVKMLESRYDLIKVSEEEQFTLGTNVLSIGNKKIFSLPINTNVNKELRSRGYEVIEVDITEIIKSGGAFRCCTMPVKRRKIE